MLFSPVAMLMPIKNCNAVKFDGTNDYISRVAGLTGVGDSKLAISSLWFRLDGGNGTTMSLLGDENTTGGAHILRNSNGTISVFGRRNADTDVVHLRTSGTFSAGPTWHHLLASWNTGVAGARHLYIDGVSDLNEITFANEVVDYTPYEISIGGVLSGGTALRYNGALAEFYFAPGQYLDFSDDANRSKFRNAAGKPQNLRGAHGPTGIAAAVYLHVNESGSAADFASNNYGGSGGAFTITGSLDVASSNPCD